MAKHGMQMLNLCYLCSLNPYLITLYFIALIVEGGFKPGEPEVTSALQGARFNSFATITIAHILKNGINLVQE